MSGHGSGTRPGLRGRMIRAAAWSMGSVGGEQALRLISSLILTRLLVPEAYGLMALANTFLIGLAMLSDIGTGPSIVQNKRGEDPDFLATAWTLQVLRGFGLFLITCAAAYPAGWLYSEPELPLLLASLGLTPLIGGFQSIGYATATRSIRLGRLTVVTLLTHVLGIGVTILWAWIAPTVWALVGGAVASSAMKVLIGHFALPSSANRFHIESTAVREILRFGRWVVASTAFTFFGGQGLTLVQGAFVLPAVLGILGLARNIAWVPVQFAATIGSSVLFPGYAEITRDRPDELRNKVRKAQASVLLLTAPIYLILILFGREIISVLYDERYQDAGTYLVILATGSAIWAQRMQFGMLLLATGDSFGPALLSFVLAISRVAGVVIGYLVNGEIGMLVADIVVLALVYPVEAWRLNRVKVSFPVFYTLVYLSFCALGALSYYYGPFLI